MGHKQSNLSLTVCLFVLIYLKNEVDGKDDDFSYTYKSPSSGATGFSFPIVGGTSPEAEAASPAEAVGRAFNNKQDSGSKKRGWLKTRGRAVDGEDQEAKKSSEDVNKSSEDGKKSSEDVKKSSEDTKKSSEDVKKSSEDSKDSKSEDPKAKYLTSFAFTDDNNEGYDKIIDAAKEEVLDQRELENVQLEQEELKEELKDAQEEAVKAGVDLGDIPAPPIQIVSSGFTKVYEQSANQVPIVDPVEYLKKLKGAFGRKNLEEIERYKKRRKLVALMEQEGLIDNPRDAKLKF